jgi:hypothetical protein
MILTVRDPVNSASTLHFLEYNVKKLYNDLFSNYTKEVMPMADHSKPLSVGVTFFLSSLNYFKEVDEMVSILGVLCLNWTDPSLTWDPASYGYLYSTVIELGAGTLLYFP